MWDCGSDIRPLRPGERDSQGGMALRVWVIQFAPDFRARRASVYVAVEWPIDTLMDEFRRVEMRGPESGSSGAMVASLMVERFEGP